MLDQARAALIRLVTSSRNPTYCTAKATSRLSDILRRLPQGTSAETLLDAMLRLTVGRPVAT